MLCPYCQEEIKDGAIKCKHCKSELTPNAQTVECGNAGSVMFPMRRFNQCLRLFVFIVPMCFAVFFIDFDNDIAGTIVQLIMCAGILLFTWILASMCLYRGESGVQIDGDNVSIYFPIIKSEVLNFRFDDIEQCTLSKKDIVISMEKPKLRITNSGSSNVNSIFLFSAFLKDKDTHFSLTIDRELFSKTVFENIKQIILARGAKIGFPIYDNSNMTLLERIEKWSNENPTSANYIRFAILAGGLLATHLPYVPIVILMSCLIFATPAHADSKTTCPEKILDTLTVEGVYLGWSEGEEWDSVKINIDGDEVYFSSSEEAANRYFKNAIGKRVVVTFELRQFLTEIEYGNCMRLEVLKNGKVLDAQPPVENKVNITIDALFENTKTVQFKTCTGSGNTVEQNCWKNGKVNSTPYCNDKGITVLTAEGTGNYEGLGRPASFSWDKEDATHIGIKNEAGYLTYELHTSQGHVYLIFGMNFVAILQ